MFDITKTAVEDTAFLHLKDAKGDLLYAGPNSTLPVGIVLYGPGSKPFSAIEARQSARAIKRMQENDGKPSVISPEERAVQEAEDLAAITLRLENLSYPPADGKDGAELFQALYADPRLGFIVKQVTRFVNDWGNFKPVSAAA